MVDATCDETRILDFQHGGGALIPIKTEKLTRRTRKLKKVQC